MRESIQTHETLRSLSKLLFLVLGARVAKLVDAPGLGPDVRKDVRVRVPPRAPF